MQHVNNQTITNTVQNARGRESAKRAGRPTATPPEPQQSQRAVVRHSSPASDLGKKRLCSILGASNLSCAMPRTPNLGALGPPYNLVTAASSGDPLGSDTRQMTAISSLCGASFDPTDIIVPLFQHDVNSRCK